MSITIFKSSPYLERACELDEYASLTFERRWWGAGIFEFTVNANTFFADQIAVERVIMVNGDVYRCGVITEVTKKIDEKGKQNELIIARGRELTWYFDRRIVNPPAGSDYYTDSDSAEGVIKELVKAQCGTNASASRQFSKLTIATDTDAGPTYKISSRYKNLLDEMVELGQSTGLGFFCYLDLTNSKFIFETGLGTDRTSGTSAPAIFTTDRDTLRAAEIRKTYTFYRNLAVVGGQGEGKERNIRNVYDTSEPTDIDRREMFVDARDLAVNADLDSRGAQKLEENGVSFYMTGRGLEYSQLIYGTDFDLGDQVTIEALGETLDTRVTSVKETWSPNRYDIDLGFERSYPELPNQVKTAVSNLQETLNKTEISEFNYDVVDIVTKTDNYTLTTDDYAVFFTGSANKTFTLPAATGTGRTYRIKHAGTGGVLTVDGNSSETIDGNLTIQIRKNQSVDLTDYASGKWGIN